MNSHTPNEVFPFIKSVRLRKAGNLLLTITYMFEPQHEYYVTDISTAIPSDRQLPLSFTKTSVKLSVNEVKIDMVDILETYSFNPLIVEHGYSRL